MQRSKWPQSFEYFVRGEDQAIGQGEAERPRSPEIEDQLVIGWRLDRQIAWICTPQDSIDVGCCLSEMARQVEVGTVVHQAAGDGKFG